MHAWLFLVIMGTDAHADGNSADKGYTSYYGTCSDTCFAELVICRNALVVLVRLKVPSRWATAWMHLLFCHTEWSCLPSHTPCLACLAETDRWHLMHCTSARGLHVQQEQLRALWTNFDIAAGFSQRVKHSDLQVCKASCLAKLPTANWIVSCHTACIMTTAMAASSSVRFVVKSTTPLLL